MINRFTNQLGVEQLRTARLEPTVRITNNKSYHDKSVEASPEGMGFKSRAEVNREKIVDTIEKFNRPTTSILSFFMETVDDPQLKAVTDNVTKYIEQYVSLKKSTTAILDIMQDRKQPQDVEEREEELRDLAALKGFEIYESLDYSIRKNNVAFDTAKAMYILGDVLFNRTDANGAKGIDILNNSGLLSAQDYTFLKNVGIGQSPLYARGATLLGYIDILHTLLNIMAREYEKNKQDDNRFNDIPRIARETIMEVEKSDDIVTCQTRMRNIWKNSGLLPKGFDVDKIGNTQDIGVQKIRAAYWSNTVEAAKEQMKLGEWKEPVVDVSNSPFGQKMVFDAQNGVNTNFKFKTEREPERPHPFANIKTPGAYRPGVDGVRTEMPPRGTIIAKSHFNWDWRPKDPQLMLYKLDNGNEIIFDPIQQRWEEQKFENQMRSLPKYNHTNAPCNRKAPTGIPEGYKDQKLSQHVGGLPVGRTFAQLNGGTTTNTNSPFNSPFTSTTRETATTNSQASYGYPSNNGGVHRLGAIPTTTSSGPTPVGPTRITPAQPVIEPNYNLKTEFVPGAKYSIDGAVAVYVIGDIFFDVSAGLYCNDRGVYFDDQNSIVATLYKYNIISSPDRRYPDENNNYSTVNTNTNNNWYPNSNQYNPQERFANNINTGEFRYSEPQRNDEIIWSTPDKPVIQGKTIHLKGVFS